VTFLFDWLLLNVGVLLLLLLLLLLGLLDIWYRH
jgi:hypothetical protein